MNTPISYRTAESVSPRHPDKLCDQISDAILDAHLEQDPDARVAAEVCGGHGEVFITGEITSSATNINYEAIVHRIAGDHLKVYSNIVHQSPEIARGVDTGGAGDQGIMIGYATSETPELLPLEVVLSRRLNQFIYDKFPFDGKTQVTLEVLPDGFSIRSILASFQNATSKELHQLEEDFYEQAIEKYNLKTEGACMFYANPAGDWSQGGFDADTGLTGRKLIVDNYGPRIPIGGGCFSGKDPSKVDRSAAYMARRIAVDYLRAEESATRSSKNSPAATESSKDITTATSSCASPTATEVLVRLAYAIGMREPLEKTVIVNGHPAEIITYERTEAQHLELSDNSEGLIRGYDLTPQGIIDYLDLKRPIYEPTARYGHFGEGFIWDK